MLRSIVSEAWVVYWVLIRVLTLILCGKKKKNIVWYENCTFKRSKCSSASSHTRSWLPPGIWRCSWLKSTDIEKKHSSNHVLPEPPMFLVGSVLFCVQPLDLVYGDKDLLLTVYRDIMTYLDDATCRLVISPVIANLVTNHRKPGARKKCLYILWPIETKHECSPCEKGPSLWKIQ